MTTPSPKNASTPNSSPTPNLYPRPDSDATLSSGHEAQINNPLQTDNVNQGSAQNTLLETTQSVLWAMLGVQSKRNAKRDFTQGKVSHFVFLGIVFAIVFVLGLALLVRSVIPEA